ncbi:MAG: FAD-binding protein, partial [Opitutales bacterium]
MSPLPGERFLFLGVGGMGMGPLACWMSRAGYSITGYDSHLPEAMRRHLVAAGVELQDFVFPEHLSGYTTVVHSSAVRAGHPLLDAAMAADMDCLRRGEMLARVVAGRKLIAIIGSHGKTTTTGMIAYGMRRCGIDANYILGGLFSDPKLPPSQYSESPWLVAEIDESDGTIEHFTPEHCMILNIDWDHADHYLDVALLEKTFQDISARTRGKVWLPEALTPGNLPEDKIYRYDAKVVEEVPCSLNASNAQGALAVLSSFVNPLPEDPLGGFSGIGRRQSTLLESEDLLVIEDYAHHPTEIGALLKKLRELAGDRRLFVVFQPHRYSRTLQFKEGFAESLSEADDVFLLPVYPAHEAALTGSELSSLVEVFGQDKPEILNMSPEGIKRIAEAAGSQPSLLAFVGAGDIELFAGAAASYLRHSCQTLAACLDFLDGRLSSETTVKKDEPLANKTTMRIGGPAKIYAEPANRADLQTLLRAVELFGIEHFCIGRGSNLLVADEGFDGLVIRFSAPNWKRMETLGDGSIWAAAGCRLKEICGFAAKAGLAGFEFLEGIPGAVGGALRMNAGAMGKWMFDVVDRVQFIDEQGKYQDWPKADFHQGYRKVEE